MIIKTLKKIWVSTEKFRKIVIIILVIYAIWFFGLGILGGFMAAKGGLSSFPEITKTDKILILSPHIDDEVIATSGIIQQAVKTEAQIKIVYMTNGDDNFGSVVREDRSLTTDPNDFINLGEKRMSEGKEATKILGLSDENLVFLGYPDKGLTLMLSSNFNKPYTSQGTSFNYNPYQGTYRQKQVYTGENILNDLEKIIGNYKPTVIFSPHPRDQHLDHSATYRYLEKTLIGKENKPKVYTYLVHYTLYPPNKKLQKYRYIFPPKKLFTKEGWYSYDLASEQENKKLEAINKNVSQIEGLTFTGTYGGFMQSFVKKNEIFELMD